MSLPKPPEADHDEGGGWGFPRDPFAGPRPEAYDALTELFLGEQAAGEAGRAGNGHPILKLVRGDAEEEGGEPAGLVETAREESSPQPEAQHSARARIEGLILGNLPVGAAPWVMQYARHASAETGGPVAIIRLHGTDGSLTVAGAGFQDALEGRDRFGSLREAVEHLAGRIAVWLIRVEEDAERSLSDLPGLDSLTLLTSADPAATAAAYQSIKSLSPGGGAAGPRAELRLALMGAGDDRAAESFERIARTAETFLQWRVTIAACLNRISGGRSHQAWSGVVEGPANEVLAGLCQIIRSRALEAPTPARRPEPPVVAVRPVEFERPSAAPDQVAAAVVDEPPTPRAPAATSSSPAAFPGSARAVETYVFTSVYPPAPGHDSSTAPPSFPPEAARAAVLEAPPLEPDDSARESLTRHLRGLSSFPFTCPYAPGVELATDEAGVLHLIALDAPGAENAAVPALLSAEAWVRDHLALLGQSAAAIDRPLLESPPTLHLLTMHAPGVLHLRESGIRLHLLVITRAGDETAWACADLN